MNNATRKLDQYGKKLQKTGKSLTVGLTAPLVALGFEAVRNFDKQAKAVAQVEQGLLSTGNAVGFTTKQLEAQAAALQNNSLFGDEDILKNATAQLLTFTNIAGEQFQRTQLAALDLATRLDGDLKSASIQLGKALNDPVANLSALSRSGIQFSKDQKTLINSLVETGRIAEAQTVILNELEKQYGGSAAAAAAAGTGPFRQFANLLSDITEDFGAIIVEGLTPLVEYLKDAALRFQQLSPETKKWIVALGGIAAAIGPLLALAGTILPAIGTGLTLLSGPIGLVVAGLAAIGVVIAKNWEPIKGTLIDIANYFIDLYNESTAFRVIVEGIITTFKNFYEIGAFVFNALGSIVSAVADNIKNAFVNVGELIRVVLTGDIEALPALLEKSFSEGLATASQLVSDLNGDFEQLSTNIESNIAQGVENALSKKKYDLLAKNVDASGVEKAVSDAVVSGLANGLQGGQSGAADLTPQLSKVDVSVGGNDIANPLGPVSEQIVTSGELIRQSVEKVNLVLVGFRESAAEIGAAVGNTFFDLANSLVDSLGLAENGFEGFLKRLAQTVIELISIALSQSLANAIAGATASGSATGPAAVFTTPAFIATAVGGVLAAFAAIPKFFQGGIVGGNSFSGDRNLIRVNSGELILNLAQQNNLARQLTNGGTAVYLQPSVDISNRKFKVMLNQVDSLNARST